jgi:Flp pilus assembly protein CpaB
MKRILLAIFIGVGALAAAIFVGSQVASHVRAQVVTAKVVVARQAIPAYAVISADMVEALDLPREVTRAPIYQGVDELVGKMARLDIPAGVPIYKVYAVPPSEVRFTEDGAAVILSVPIDTVRAVGGLVQAGHRVDIYRIAKARPQGDRLSPDDLLALHGAAVEMVSPDVRVLGVKAIGATQVTNKVESNPALPGLAVPLVAGTQRQGGGGAGNATPNGSQTPGPVRSAGAESISIVTVEVSQQVAVELLRLVGELSDRYDLWLTLSPTQREDAVLAEVAPISSVERQARLVALTPSPTVAPAATATPAVEPTSAPLPTASPTVTTAPGVVVKPGPAQALNVRSGPGLGYEIVGTLAAGVRLEPVGRNAGGDWLAVCCVAANGNPAGRAVGWVLAQMVDVGGLDISTLPVLPAPAISAPLPPTPQAAPTAEPAQPEYRSEVSYANEPGDKRLNYVRASVLDADGAPMRAGVTLSWPDGSVSCPGDREPKAEGYCEFIVTEGEFTVTPAEFPGQLVKLVLPHDGQHTVASVTWRRSR